MAGRNMSDFFSGLFYRRRIGPITVGILCIFVGVVLLPRGILSAATARRTAHWQTAPGSVQVSRVDVIQRAGVEVVEIYAPYVEYQYTVEGNTYTSHSIKPGSPGTFSGLEEFDNREQAEAIRTRYPLGASVTVHYDPKKPQASALELPNYQRDLYLTIGFVVAGMLIAVVFLAKGYER
jgi:hypothetical protein